MDAFSARKSMEGRCGDIGGCSEREGLWRLSAYLARLLAALFYLGVLVGLRLLFTGESAPTVLKCAMSEWPPQGDLTDQPRNGKAPYWPALS